MDKFDLEERLISFAVLIIEIASEMAMTKAGNHLSGQLKIILRKKITPNDN